MTFNIKLYFSIHINVTHLHLYTYHRMHLMSVYKIKTYFSSRCEYVSLNFYIESWASSLWHHCIYHSKYFILNKSKRCIVVSCLAYFKFKLHASVNIYPSPPITQNELNRLWCLSFQIGCKSILESFSFLFIIIDPPEVKVFALI